MAIYGPDGNVLFTAEEEKRHHIWCYYYFKPRKGCEGCERLYLNYPYKGEMMKEYFPNVEVIK